MGLGYTYYVYCEYNHRPEISFSVALKSYDGRYGRVSEHLLLASMAFNKKSAVSSLLWNCYLDYWLYNILKT